ncbi:MAG: helix-hairpin-helix domain-containing protein [Candidatus Eisenbacteria bacterium]|nr:helix-hairpin-helix domain-containing protein [Candidatus Eisenbacteria bacterium]
MALGAAHDLWRARHPRPTPPPAPLPAAASAPPAAAPIAPASPRAPLDLNRAGAAELDALPGIGPVLAGRIVAHRTRFGPFREPGDLLAVPGIGPRLFERLRPLVTAAATGRDSISGVPGR